jgi:predicted DCC family thiol-disulfide oxidoreductase YuxK
VYVVLDYAQPGERLAARSDAVVALLRELGGIWGALAVVLGMLPTWFRDWSYNLIARRRYRIFGKYESCPLPGERDRRKFLDL